MPAPRTPPSLESVVDALRRGLAAEVRFLRRGAAGVPELALRAGRALGPSRAGRWLFRFETDGGPNERFGDQDALLVAPTASLRASVVEVARNEVVVEVGQAIAPGDPWRLVFRPGMLLERLAEALERCLHDPRFSAETALRSLALRPSGPAPSERQLEPPAGLNQSQRRAVATALARDLTLIWGPPGTGKTRVIAHLVAELCRAGERVLLTSNTNAAVDNAVAALEAARAPVAVYRVGRGRLAVPAAPSPVAVAQRQRLDRWTTGAQLCQRLLDQVAATPRQQSLPFSARAPLVRRAELEELFPGRAAELAGLCREALQAALTRRKERLDALVRGYQERLSLAHPGTGAEREAMARAQVVAATLTSTYTVEHLASHRFDAVVVDEASMAGLPLIFHCAGRATRRAIFVGDPRQLPPIVEAPDPVARATLGRTVFDLGGRETGIDGVLLDTQYRMHPAIGDLVSALYYQGRLGSVPPPPETVRLAAGEPFPGAPLVAVDLAGTRHRCLREGRSSRINRVSADAAVALATAAARAGATVAIITPYAAQARLVRSLLAAAPSGATNAITCATVHRFQGAEADVVIIDLVDAPPLRPGVLLNDQAPGSPARALVTVSVSRARAKLIVLADLPYFRDLGGGPVTELLQALEARGRVYPPGGAPILPG